MRPTLSMTTVLLALAFLLPATTIAQLEDDPLPPADGEAAQVLAVVDGDTIRVELEDGTIERVRYIGIDTPELEREGQAAEPFGPRAAAANAGYVEGRSVILERDVSDRDQFDRLLRYVWVDTEDGPVMINERLVALGLAEVNRYEPDTRYHDHLLATLDHARDTGRGMFDADALSRAVFGAEAMAYLFMDAYDARDRATLRQLMHRDVRYELPGDVAWEGKQAVLDRFSEEWSNEEPAIEIRSSIAQPDAAVLELTITRLAGEEPGSIAAVGVQRWRNDRLVRYRLYRDDRQ